MEKQKILQACTVEGNVVKLPPGQLDRKLYTEVAKALELIGGKWKGNKIMGFVFPTDPTDLLAQISSGEKRNLKKEFQFFETPKELAKEMVRDAWIEKGHRVLEPSAGQGAIVKALFEFYPFLKQVDCCELMPINKTFLEKIDGVHIIGDDFLSESLQITYANYYDRIIANPPFAKNQDIDHIYAMYNCLKPGGKLITLSSTHWNHVDQKKEREFLNWVYETVDGRVEKISAGTFAESGTNIETFMITINK